MTYKNHYRVTASGVFLNTTEIWSYGLQLAIVNNNSPDSIPLDPNDTVWDDVADDFASFHGDPNAEISQLAELRTVKIAPIGSDGRYTGDSITKARVQAGGGETTYYFPIQNALAVTLKTASPLSRVKGRFYLPAPTIAMDSSARITSIMATQVQGAVDTFLENLNNQPGLDVLNLGVAVASGKGAGQNWPVTEVTVGRVIDTVRTRRNRLVEAYVSDVAVDD